MNRHDTHSGRIAAEATESMPKRRYGSCPVCCAAAIMSGRDGQSGDGECATLIGDERGMAPVAETLLKTLIAVIIVLILYIFFYDTIREFFFNLFAPIFDRLNAIFD